MDTTKPQPDLQALALTKAIAQKESGGNYNASGDVGTSTGAYQYQAATWKNYAQQILGNANAEMTPENQNAVTYGMVKTWKDQGMGPADIAARWNAGANKDWMNNVGTTTINGQEVAYNTPQYVKDVVDNFKQIYPQVSQKFGGQPQPQQDSPSVGGFVGNVFSSAGSVLGGLANVVMHPIDTATSLISTAAGGVEKGLNATGLTNINNSDTQNFDGLVDFFKHRYGGDSVSEVVHNIGHTLYTDPVGAALDLSTLLDGVGAAVGKVGKIADIAKATELSKAADFITTAQGIVKSGSPEAITALQKPGMLTKIADSVKAVSEYTNPISKGADLAMGIGKPIVNTAGEVAKSALSHATGMNFDTISNIVKSPEEFSKAAIEQTSRGGALEDVTKGLQELQKSYSETGKLYSKITSDTSKVVTLPENFLQDILNKGTVTGEGNAIPLGYTLEPIAGGGYKVVAGTEAKYFDQRSVTAMQNFVDRWGDKTTLTPKEFMNMRQEAAKMGKIGREIGENKAAAYVGKQIQGELNKTVRPQIEGLKAADEASAPQINLINKVKKDLYNADGTLKDNAASKVANALNKDNLLSRLEEVSPGIGHKLEILKSVEDLEHSMGIKVGTYTRSAGELFSIGTGNIPMLVGLIMTHPTIAKQLLRATGYVGAKAMPILGRVRALLGALPGDVAMPLLKTSIINNSAQQKTTK